MTEVLFEIDRNRPVEWLCVFAMLRGYIPSSAYQRSYASPASVYYSPRTSGQVTRLSASDGYLIAEWGRIDHWRKCSNCQCEYPETREYWHRDSNGRGGLQTICKYCRCESRREDYQRKHRLPN